MLRGNEFDGEVWWSNLKRQLNINLPPSRSLSNMLYMVVKAVHARFVSLSLVLKNY